MRVRCIGLILASLLLVLSGCNERQVSKQRMPKLTVRVEPSDAQVDVVPLVEIDGVLKVKIRVKDRSIYGVTLSAKDFLSTRVEISEPFKEATATLVRFSVEPDRIEESFKRAAKAYHMDLAYPKYIPKGFELGLARLDVSRPRAVYPERPAAGMLFLEWRKNKNKGMMLTYPSGANWPQLGRPTKYTTITLPRGMKARIHEHVEARINENSASLIGRNGKAVVDIGISAPRPVFLKILRNMRVVEP